LKILILSHAQYITVALPKVIEFAETLASKGHAVTLVATHKKYFFKNEIFINNGVKYVLSPSILFGRYRHGADFYDSLYRIFLLKNNKYDVIHAIDSRPSVILPALFLKYIKKVPLILEWSDYFSDGGTIQDRSGKIYANTIGYIESLFEKGFRLKADAAVVVTTKIYKKLIDIGFPRNKIIIHRMGFKKEQFKNNNKTLSREKLHLHNDEVIFSYFGRIHDNDHKLILNAFTAFKEQNTANVNLLFIGNTKPIFKNNMPYVKYIGYVTAETYQDYLYATDICLLPLKITNGNLARWPSKFVDYLAASKPVVATPVSDFKQFFKYNIGILVKKDTEKEFCNSLSKILNERDNWDQMGDNGRNYANKNLTWEHLTDQIIKFYKKFVI